MQYGELPVEVMNLLRLIPQLAEACAQAQKTAKEARDEAAESSVLVMEVQMQAIGSAQEVLRLREVICALIASHQDREALSRAWSTRCSSLLLATSGSKRQGSDEDQTKARAKAMESITADLAEWTALIHETESAPNPE